MCQNSWYMIRLAWTTGEKKVIILSLLSALFAVAYVRIYRQGKMCDRYNRNKEALAGAFGLGAVTQYVTSITKVSGGMSNLVAAFGDMRNNAAFLEL